MVIAGNRIISLCTSRIYDPQVFTFIRSLNEALRGKDIRLLVYSVNSDRYWDEETKTSETAIFDLIPFEQTELVIIMDERIKSRRISDELISRAGEYSVPVLVVDGIYDGIASVCFDYSRGFEAMVRHIIGQHSVRRIHMMAGYRNNRFSDERIDAFRRVLAEYDIPFDDSMVSYGDFWSLPSVKLLRSCLTEGSDPKRSSARMISWRSMCATCSGLRG